MPLMQRYTAFQSHTTDVRRIITENDVLITLCANAVTIRSPLGPVMSNIVY